MNPQLITALAALVLAATCVCGQTAVPAQYFGMHLSRSQPWPTVPFGSLRLWDTDTRWQQMNPASGVYDFSTLDSYLALAHSHGLSDVVLVLGGTPSWISSDPLNSACDYAAVASGSCAPPMDLNSDGTGTDQAWRSFIYQLVTHVMGLDAGAYSRIAAYEMWNEFSRTTESWTGSQAQMVRLAQDAYCILKGSGTITATGEVCAAQAFHVPAVGIAPQAVVVSPSAQASGPDVYTLGTYLSNLGSAGPGAAAADAIAVHNYTYGSACCAFAEALIVQWSALQMAIPGAACELRVWSTEGSWGDTATKEPDPDMQSAYVARAYLLGWSVGFQRMYWYAWGNSWGRLWSQSGVAGCSDQGSGTGCASPASRAYAEVYSWMVGNTMNKPCSVTGSVYSCQLTTGQGARLLAVWDTAKSCTGGICGHSVYQAPPGYNSYLDLSHTHHGLRGQAVWIGAKPILLLSSTLPPLAKARRKARAVQSAIRVRSSAALPLSVKACNPSR
ncbi:MAG TPA: hypothetical protein VHS34_15085 [Terriglobales bacterium]|jgi:hypothetical protein|nr:hypothetical protein [Terriglobales bacterium]